MIVAIGLAVLAMVLALRQIQTLTHFLQAQAQNRAVQIANNASSTFDREIDAAFRSVAADRLAHPDAPWDVSVNQPGWIDGLYAWDATALVILAAAADAPKGFSAFVENRLAQWHATNPPSGPPASQLLYDAIGSRPIVLACRRYSDANGALMVLAARIHLRRLLTGLVEPLISPSDGLEAVPLGDVSGPWHQPMFGVTRFWALQPTRAFLNEQRSKVMGQTLTYLCLTVLSLATLLGAMWYLARLTRRELALVEMKANFVADVSHELKTPLATIRLFGETLQSGRVASEEKRREYYSIITRETTRLTNLINNILDFARIEAGRKVYTPKPTDIRQVIRETYETYTPLLDHNQVEHHLTMDEQLPKVDADRDAIAQVILNLMANAVKYSGDERYLAVDVTSDTRRGRRGVLISVHDRGIGIKPEDHSHLFEGFFRASDSRVRDRGGAGLGLALVKHIVDAHNGSLHVESRLVKGTTFRIFLPASTQDT